MYFCCYVYVCLLLRIHSSVNVTAYFAVYLTAIRIFTPITISQRICRHLCVSQIATHHVTGHNTPIHNILSTTPQLSISQKTLGTLPEDGNVMPKHVRATIHNQ
jgi:hypothetical protein